MINKYIGDAVMAIWNTPVAHKTHAASACQAALDMKKIVDAMPVVSARVGLNTGPMVAGNLGHAERMEYTVIGDAVNLASRLEGANKPFGTDIMISETTEEQVRGKFLIRPLDRIRVIGRENPVRVYELLAGIDEPVDELHGSSLLTRSSRPTKRVTGMRPVTRPSSIWNAFRMIRSQRSMWTSSRNGPVF